MTLTGDHVTAVEGGPLYPTAKAEPELGGGASYVVATVEMTPIHEIKPEPTIAVMTSSSPVVVAANPMPVPLQLQEKLGNKCCGCCCDYRRAVIIVNACLIGIGVFTIMAQGTAEELLRDNYDDDAFLEEVTTILDEYEKMRSIFVGVGLVTAVIAQAGAVHFNIWMVAFHCVSLVVDYVAFAILTLNLEKDLEDPYESVGQEPGSPVPNILFSGVAVALFLYPHLGFIQEVKSGILTRETYPREEFSCCCSSSNNRAHYPQSPPPPPPPH